MGGELSNFDNFWTRCFRTEKLDLFQKTNLPNSMCNVHIDNSVACKQTNSRILKANLSRGQLERNFVI